MRRTKKDIEHLYNCYCQAWQSEDVERTERIEKHGWISNVWTREYDGVARMTPTEEGRQIVIRYRSFKSESRVEGISATEVLDEI